jgi:hypothetical protein
VLVLVLVLMLMLVLVQAGVPPMTSSAVRARSPAWKASHQQLAPATNHLQAGMA